jgi:hypothetical protein
VASRSGGRCLREVERTVVFVFIATNRVRPGRLDDERRRVPGWVDLIGRHEPRLIAFHEFLNEDGSEVEYVQLHPDAASFEHHLDVLARVGDSYRATLAATTAVRIYGTVTESILTALRASFGPDVPITVAPKHLGGFTRGH